MAIAAGAMALNSAKMPKRSDKPRYGRNDSHPRTAPERNLASFLELPALAIYGYLQQRQQPNFTVGIGFLKANHEEIQNPDGRNRRRR